MSESSNFSVRDRLIDLSLFEVAVRVELKRLVEDVGVMRHGPVEIVS